MDVNNVNPVDGQSVDNEKHSTYYYDINRNKCVSHYYDHKYDIQSGTEWLECRRCGDKINLHIQV
jgi:hypothetical protein